VADLAATFRKPFAEQVAAFLLRLSNPVPTARWDDISREAHNSSFMVAGAIKADLLADLGQAVRKAIEDGTGLDAFAKDFRRIVAERGWHGWTGEGTEKGEAWRIRTIYRTNMRTSYAAGRLAQLVDGKYKYWIYRHGGSREPRIQHLAWDKVALAPDHPFWNAHLPPNGWGCSCYVDGARTEAGVRRLGGDPDKALPENWDARDPRTGAPVGIDKGWDYAPGRSTAETVLTLRDKFERLPPQASIDLIQDWVKSGIFEAWFAAPKGNFPLVRISEPDADRIGALKRVADLSAETAIKQKREHPELTIWDYAEAQRVVSEATEVIRDGPSSIVFLLEVPGANGYVLVVKATRTGQGLYVTSFRRVSADDGERARFVAQIRRRALE
jgi:hypothetical protein